LVERWVREEKCRIKIGCAFFVTFFAQTKKVKWLLISQQALIFLALFVLRQKEH